MTGRAGDQRDAPGECGARAEEEEEDVEAVDGAPGNAGRSAVDTQLWQPGTVHELDRLRACVVGVYECGSWGGCGLTNGWPV